jgi:hypothetical protein
MSELYEGSTNENTILEKDMRKILDRSYTAAVGIHRNAIYSLYFGPTCEILIDKINTIDFDRVRENLKTNSDTIYLNNIIFNLKTCEIGFPGIELSTGRYIVGGRYNAQLIKLPATKDEILYILSTVLHMFAGDK